VKKNLTLIFKIIISTGIIIFLINSNKLNFSKLSVIWVHKEIYIVILLIFIFLLIPLITLRWKLILKEFNTEIRFFDAFRIVVIGNYFSMMLPGSVSGDFVRGYYLYKKSILKSKIKIFLSLFADRISGITGLLLLTVFISLFNIERIGDNEKLIFFIILAFILLGFILAVIYASTGIKRMYENSHIYRGKHYRKIKVKVYNILDGFAMLGRNRRMILISFSLSLVSFVLIILAYLMIIYSLDIPIADYFSITVIITFGIVSTIIPVAPSGIGVGHAAFYYLFKIIDIDDGADIYNIFLMIQIVMNLLGGMMYFTYTEKIDTTDVPEYQKI